MNRLDSELLRTFLAVAETGSVSSGAARIHRSQSAASVQVKQLEDLLGKAVFLRHGRGVHLTEAGERLAPIARSVIDTLDATLSDIGIGGVEGSLRIGIPDEHGKDVMTRIIAEFARDHPKVDLAVHCALSTDFPEALNSGDLDLAIHEVVDVSTDMEVLRSDTLCWAMSSHASLDERDPIPVALFDRACWWRDAALNSIRASGRPFQVIFSSESVAGVVAALEAGIAIGVVARTGLTSKLVPVPKADEWYKMPTTHLVLERSPAADDRLCETMTKAVKRAFETP